MGLFEPILIIFDQFLPIFSEILHSKVLGAHLFKQARLFGALRYIPAANESLYHQNISTQYIENVLPDFAE